MNASPHLPEFGRPARTPVFFWITIALLGLLFLGGAAGALLLVFEAKSINRSGGWGWLLVAAIYVVAIVVVCFACALSSAVSLFRREAHRRLSIAILIISSLVVAAFGPTLIRAVHKLRHQQHEADVTKSREVIKSITKKETNVSPFASFDRSGAGQPFVRPSGVGGQRAML